MLSSSESLLLGEPIFSLPLGSATAVVSTFSISVKRSEYDGSSDSTRMPRARKAT